MSGFLDIHISKSATSIVAISEGDSSPTLSPIRDYDGRLIARWGHNNLHPQDVLRETEKTPALNAGLDKQARLAYAGGFQYGIETVDDNGDVVFIPTFDPEIKRWLTTCNFKHYLMAAFQDFYHFINVFPEIVLSPDRQKVIAVYHQDATDCRWEKRDPADQIVKTCYINSQWEIENEWNEHTIQRPVINPYYDSVNATKLRDDGTRYIYPCSYPTPGKKYYSLAHWNAVRPSGWLENLQQVPIFKTALMKNQATVKYILKIPESWFWWKYGGKPNWEKKTQAERDAALDEIEIKIEKILTGAENAGKSIVSIKQSDPNFTREFPGIEIESVDDKIKDGIYIEDAQEAVSQVLTAINLPIVLLGNVPSSNGMGAGSGSDIEAYLNNYFATIQPHIDVVSNPFMFAAQFNGWDERIENDYMLKNPGKPAEFKSRFKQPYMQSLSNIAPTNRSMIMP